MPDQPIAMILFCPRCGDQHVDAADHATGWGNPPHRSHLCGYCGHVWRPADVATTGVSEIGTEGEHDSVPKIRSVAIAPTPTKPLGRTS